MNRNSILILHRRFAKNQRTKIRHHLLGHIMTISPGGEYALQEEDELVVLGRNEDIREVERL